VSVAASDPLGRLAVLLIVLVLFYDVLFAIVKANFESIIVIFEGLLTVLEEATITIGGNEAPLIPNSQNLLESLFSWSIFIFTNSMALALIIMIDIIKTAFRG